MKEASSIESLGDSCKKNLLFPGGPNLVNTPGGGRNLNLGRLLGEARRMIRGAILYLNDLSLQFAIDIGDTWRLDWTDDTRVRGKELVSRGALNEIPFRRTWRKLDNLDGKRRKKEPRRSTAPLIGELSKGTLGSTVKSGTAWLGGWGFREAGF